MVHRSCLRYLAESGEGRKSRPSGAVLALPLATPLPFLEHQLLFPLEWESVDNTTNGGPASYEDL